MRAALLVGLVALTPCGCRDDAGLAGPDLSSPSLYCPPNPPLATPFPCDPTAIPYCTYPAQQQTCTCRMGADGIFFLVCLPERFDGGVAPD